MQINFKGLEFQKENNIIKLIKCGFNKRAIDEYHENLCNFVEVDVSGEDKNSHYGNKMIYSSEGNKLVYVSHVQTENSLVIIQKSEIIEVKTEFIGYNDNTAVSVQTEVKNITDKEIVLEEVSAFTFLGLANGINDTKDTYFYKFTNSHHGECQPRKYSLFDLGLFNANPVSQKRVFGANIGS